jgi:hypothetical protein
LSAILQVLKLLGWMPICGVVAGLLSLFMGTLQLRIANHGYLLAFGPGMAIVVLAVLVGIAQSRNPGQSRTMRSGD